MEEEERGVEEGRMERGLGEETEIDAFSEEKVSFQVEGNCDVVERSGEEKRPGQDELDGRTNDELFDGFPDGFFNGF